MGTPLLMLFQDFSIFIENFTTKQHGFFQIPYKSSFSLIKSIGSISPSYILGKILKKLDTRDVGTRNAGTVNTYNVLGLWPAIITAGFDLSKGLLAMYFAHLFGVSPLIMHLSGFAAVLGYVFPFYLHFRGGQGVATATAILIYYLILFYTKE